MVVLKVEHLHKNYGKKQVLNDCSFEIHEGDLIGLVGPNGIGKSTLMRSILNLEDVESGTVTLLGISNKEPDFYKQVTFMPSDNYLYTGLSGYDHLAFVANIYGLEKSKIDEVIEKIGIGSYVHQTVKTYSYGMRQHLLIALAVLTDPKLILMDEPFNGLDPTSVIELKRLIHQLHELNISIVVSTHSLGILEDLTSTVWFLKDGQLTQTIGEVHPSANFEIEVGGMSEAALEELMSTSGLAYSLKHLKIQTEVDGELSDYLSYLMAQNVEIIAVNRRKENLEEIYQSFYGV